MTTNNFLADSYTHKSNALDALRSAKRFIAVSAIFATIDVLCILWMLVLPVNILTSAGMACLIIALNICNICFVLISLPGLAPRGTEAIIYKTSHYGRIVASLGLLLVWFVHFIL